MNKQFKADRSNQLYVWQKQGIEPSVGSNDIAPAETINGLYKAELMHRRAPWKTKEPL